MHAITLPIAELKPALTGLAKVVNRQAALPALQCLRVERTSEGWICLTGCDLNSFVTVRFEQPASGSPFAMLVNLEELTRLAKTFGKGESLELILSDKGDVAARFPLAGHANEVEIKPHRLADFPVIPRLKQPSIKLLDPVRTSLQQALACSSNDPGRVVLMGAYLDASKPNAHYLVGTDGRHLYSSNSFSLPLKESLIIPKHKFLGWRDFNLDGEWQLRAGNAEGLDQTYVQFSSRRWRFISKTVDGKYPDWRNVVPNPQQEQTCITLDPSASDAVERAVGLLPCHEETYRTMGLECRQGQLHLMGKATGDAPWLRTLIQGASYTGPDTTVYLDRRLFLKALEFGLLKIGIIDPISPLRFSHEGRQMIVMPVRIHDQTEPPAQVPPPVQAIPPARSPHTGVAAPQRRYCEPQLTNESVGSPTSGEPSVEEALQVVEELRGTFGSGLTRLRDLSAKLRQIQRGQKTNDRELRSVRQTLKVLQGVRL